MESFAPTSGWVAVLVSLASAVFLPIITMGIAAFCLPRKRMQTPDEHWTERARSLFPFKAIRILSVSVLPILYATGANFYPDSMMPIPSNPPARSTPIVKLPLEQLAISIEAIAAIPE